MELENDLFYQSRPGVYYELCFLYNDSATEVWAYAATKLTNNVFIEKTGTNGLKWNVDGTCCKSALSSVAVLSATRWQHMCDITL